MREVVFGMEDGLVSTLGVITGVAAGTANSFVVLLTGFVVVCVESLSMAAGTYLSSKSLTEVEKVRLQQLRKSIKNNPDKNEKKLRTLYRRHGLTPREIRLLVRHVTQKKKVWTEELALHELGIVPGNRRNAKKDAGFMGVSYIGGGLVPVLPYLFFSLSVAMICSFVLTAGMLFMLGYGKSVLTKTNPFKGGFEMMLISSAAAIIGFVIGKLVAIIFGVAV